MAGRRTADIFSYLYRTVCSAELPICNVGKWVLLSWRFGHAEALREVGPQMPERGSQTSTGPVIWANLEYFRRDPNDFLSRLVTMDETWLYHYDPRQSNSQWSSGIAAHPNQNIPSAKFRLNIPRLHFFGINTAFSSLNILQKTKLSTRSVTYICWCISRTIWKIKSSGNSPRDLDLERQCPVSPGTCNPNITVLPGLPVSWSPTLISGSRPVWLPPVPWTEETIEC